VIWELTVRLKMFARARSPGDVKPIGATAGSMNARTGIELPWSHPSLDAPAAHEINMTKATAGFMAYKSAGILRGLPRPFNLEAALKTLPDAPERSYRNQNAPQGTTKTSSLESAATSTAFTSTADR
jgi:hypothetical protein